MKGNKRTATIALSIILLAGLLYAARNVVYQIDPIQCRWCGRCMVECPSQAVYADTINNVLLIDQVLCNGCGICLQACPYGAVDVVTGNADDNQDIPVNTLSCFPNPIQNQATFSFNQSKDRKQAQLIIFNAKGQCVRKFTLNTSISVTWDCKDEQGRKVPDGLYFATLHDGTAKTTIKLSKVN